MDTVTGKSQPKFCSPLENTATSIPALLQQATELIERQAALIDNLQQELTLLRLQVRPAELETVDSEVMRAAIYASPDESMRKAAGAAVYGSASPSGVVVVGKSDLELRQRVMYYLQHKRIQTVPRLMRLTNSTYEQMTSIINQLVSEGIAARTSDRMDARVTLAANQVAN